MQYTSTEEVNADAAYLLIIRIGGAIGRLAFDYHGVEVKQVITSPCFTQALVVFSHTGIKKKEGA